MECRWVLLRCLIFVSQRYHAHCKREGRSDGKEGHGGSGQEGQMGDDKTKEERDDEGVVRKDRG
jgi:hypothetical protein